MLDEAKWVNIGKTYRNTESAKVFTQAIAHVARAEVAAEVEAAKFVSILSDGSTDSAIKEQEMFYIRTALSLGVKNLLKPCKVATTRSVGHIHRAINTLLTS
ncbi:hypothetical protein LSH36_298g02069 [Paralvinella palmiformis]|uniref:DUF4371 domain-containing protein n=1 Tax=Paralvinella palmiformis TaxID=53620 RepID=A0AAD9JJM1_9ANNE|nr:hypothetical protein LSH36_298g02069 [Paralvinella palmiformis]